MTDYVGRTLGPYRLEVMLGKGGMATVYRAYQASVKRYVAIKVMSPEVASQPGFKERFDREAEVIASLEHPHIVPVIDYGTEDGTNYLVMRYIEGGSLEDRMRKSPLTLREAARFLDQIASALSYAHKRGVIHRDLKPNNVLLDSGENAYLTDFGIARLAQSQTRLTATGSVMGTPAYMSPEQGMGSPVDARSDLYTLGVVLYEMVLNRLPFAADTPAAMIFQHVYEKPKDPQEIRPDLPNSVIVVLNKAIAKSPDDRFQSASDMSSTFANAISAPARRAAEADMDQTLVGGPLQPVVSGGKTTARGSKTSEAAGQEVKLIPQPSRPPRALIAGIIVVVIALIAVGSVVVLNNNNALIAVQQTSTAAALLSISAGSAPTSTMPVPIASTVAPTVAPTVGQTVAPTTAPTNVPTTAPTVGPNGTLTMIAAQMATDSWSQLEKTATALLQSLTDTAAPNVTATQLAAAAQVNQTATALAQPTRAPSATPAQAVPSTSTPNLTLAALGNIMKTNVAVAGATDVVAGTNTAVVRSIASPTVPATATPNQTLVALGNIMKTNVAAAGATDIARITVTAPASGATSAPGTDPYLGSPQTAINQLWVDGKLPARAGSQLLNVNQLDLTVPQANLDYWQKVSAANAANDFALSAEVTWNAPDVNNACGLLFRYNPGDSGFQNYSFYSFAVYRNGYYQSWIRDTFGYRASPTVSIQSPIVNSADGATNHLLVIAQGNHFSLYLNGQLAGSFTDNTLPTGSIALLGSRLQNSGGLACHFRNIWAYSLQ